METIDEYTKMLHKKIEVEAFLQILYFAQVPTTRYHSS
jgi:hypothetical protein